MGLMPTGDSGIAAVVRASSPGVSSSNGVALGPTLIQRRVPPRLRSPEPRQRADRMDARRGHHKPTFVVLRTATRVDAPVAGNWDVDRLLRRAGSILAASG